MSPYVLKIEEFSAATDPYILVPALAFPGMASGQWHAMNRHTQAQTSLYK